MRRLIRTGRHLLSVVGALVVVSCTPLVEGWATVLAGPWNDPSGEVLVVLGAERVANSVIGLSSYWRCVYASRAYKQGTFRRIIVSGADAAPLMRDFLVSQGVPATVITVENAATNTWQNALLTKKLLDNSPGRVVLLTSDFHMFRARRCFTKVGLHVLPRPFPDIRKRASHWTERFPALLVLAEETAKICWYWIHGHI